MTKRFFYGLVIGLATFAIGLSLVSILNAGRPISLCELEANPKFYAGKTIRFRAVIERSRHYITAGSTCRNGEIAGAVIELNSDEAAKFPLPESVRLADGESGDTYLMDAVISGQLNPIIGPGCFAPKYHVSGARVERVFSVRQFNNIREVLQWFKSNSY
jgi:hypothetical protein